MWMYARAKTSSPATPAMPTVTTPADGPSRGEHSTRWQHPTSAAPSVADTRKEPQPRLRKRRSKDDDEPVDDRTPKRGNHECTLAQTNSERWTDDAASPQTVVGSTATQRSPRVVRAAQQDAGGATRRSPRQMARRALTPTPAGLVQLWPTRMPRHDAVFKRPPSPQGTPAPKRLRADNAGKVPRCSPRPTLRQEATHEQARSPQRTPEPKMARSGKDDTRGAPHTGLQGRSDRCARCEAERERAKQKREREIEREGERDYDRETH